MIASDTWTITDGGSTPSPCPNPFTFEVKTDNTGASNNDQFKLPLVSDGTINFNVDWGDSSSDTITAYNDAAVTHTYSAAGTYTIKMEGTIRGWRFFWGGDPQKVLDISKWGDFDITQQGTFAGCTNLSCSATDYPALSGNTLSYAFYQCTPLNMDVSGWDVSSVTTMGGSFTLCSNFTGVGMDGWNVSSVTNFSSAFYGTAINEDISGWNTSNCTDMGQMFSQNAVFNQDIGSWDVSNVTSFGGFLQSNQVFNQDLSSWNTGSVTSMNDMFYGCLVFDSDISSWDVSNVTNFQNTFNGCTAFSADLSSWNVTSVCERTIGMFQYATSFNADISGWDVSGVKYFNSMFRGANFDQDIGGWDTSSGLNMSYMFRDDNVFDQDISSWDISNVANFDSFMQGATLSTANYDLLLVAWEAQTVVSGITISFGGSTYSLSSAAATARADLIAAPNLWTITDGGGV
jgi:surface protein